MAGSYGHAVDGKGRLRNWRNMLDMVETRGDVYETIEEMYGMIWYLAEGNAAVVGVAQQHYDAGLAFSPGKEPDFEED